MVIMATHISRISIGGTVENDVVDITQKVQEIVNKSKFRNGIANAFVTGATGAITTLEYEPGLLKDIPAAMERLFPKNIEYGHEEAWHDGNGHSHVRASFLGPGITIPVEDGRLLLGTWQQIVFLELDNKPRKRELVVTLVGD